MKPILDTLQNRIEIQIEMKWYIFPSVQRLCQTATLQRKLRGETGLLNTCLAGHHSVLVDGGDHGGDGLLPVGVEALEGVPEVVEDLGEEAARVGHDQADAVLPAGRQFNRI